MARQICYFWPCSEEQVRISTRSKKLLTESDEKGMCLALIIDNSINSL